MRPARTRRRTEDGIEVVPVEEFLSDLWTGRLLGE